MTISLCLALSLGLCRLLPTVAAAAAEAAVLEVPRAAAAAGVPLGAVALQGALL